MEVFFRNSLRQVADLDTGEDVTEPRKTGELRIKSSTMMKGYVGNPKATAEAFDEDGWLKSGDLVYFDEEGTFYYVDRIKEMIKYKSYQVKIMTNSDFSKRNILFWVYERKSGTHSQSV